MRTTGAAGRRRVRASWAALAVLFLGAGVARGGEPASAWRDEKVIARRFSEACDAVEQTCGAKFVARPTVKVSGREEVTEILKAELAQVYGEGQTEGEKGMAKMVERMANLLSKAMLAKYEPAKHVVHVIAENAEGGIAGAKKGEAPTEDLLRIVLAHEVTHALDWPRFGLEAKRVAPAKQDARQAFNSVVEGHAQWVAEQVAWTWGLTADFERFTKAIAEVPEIADPDARRMVAAVVAEISFAYVQGLSFVKACAKAGGRAKIEVALSTPPDSTRWIEHPEDWLARGGVLAGKEPDLDAAVEAFRFLVGDPAWTVVATRASEALLKTQASAVPEDKRKDYLRGWVDGRFLVGQMPSEDRQVVVIVGLFTEEADAASFVALERAALEAKDKAHEVGPIRIVKVEYAEGAGAEGKVAGFVAHKDVEAMGKTIPVDLQTFAVGRVAGQVMLVNSPDIDRKAQDAAIARLQTFLADPVGFAALPKPDPVAVSRKTRTLEIAVLDPDGKPVPKALVRAWDPDGPPRPADRAVAKDGVAHVTIGKGSGWTLSVWGAADAKGDPLGFAPREGVAIPAEGERLEVRLEPGAAVRGTVVDEGGKPARGVKIEASPVADSGRPMRSDVGVVCSSATSAADGTFEVVGLAPHARYRLDLSKDDVPATESGEATAGDTGVRITFRAGMTVTLTVVGPDDKPLGGVIVWATDFTSMRDLPHGGAPWPREGTSGADGRVVLKGLVADREYQVSFHSPDAGLSEPNWERWKPADARVRFERGWTAGGVVLDEKGAPVPRAVVWRKTGRARSSERADAEGRFEMRGLPPGPIRLWATVGRDDLWDDADEKGAVEATPEKSHVVLRIARKAMVVIRVLDPAGKPVASAEGWVETVGRGWSLSLANGEGSINRPGGPFSVSVSEARSSDGQRLAPATREDLPADVPEVEIRLEPALSISGRVVDEEGKPVEGAALTARATAGRSFPHPFWGSSDRPQAAATSGADGAFRIEGLGRGKQTVEVLRVADPFVPPPPSEIEAGSTDARIVVHKGVALDVPVVDWNGAPLVGARVHVVWNRPEGQGSWQEVPIVDSRTDAKGAFRLPPRDPGQPLKLSVEAPDDRDDVARVEDEQWHPKAGEPIRAARGYVVSGVVRDGLGRPVRASIIRRETRESGNEVRGMSWTSELDVGASEADGTFRLRGVPYGPAPLRAVPVGGDWGSARESAWVEATPEHSSVDLVAFAKVVGEGSVTVRVAGAKTGRTGTLVLESAAVGEARSLGLRFDDEGVAVTQGVLAGKYSVWIPAYGDDDRRICFRTGVAVEGGDLTLDLTEGQPVKFKVVLPEKAEVESVEVIGPLGFAIEADDAGDGHYVVKALPPGTWKVKVRAYLGRKALAAEADAEAGGPEVTVAPK